MDRENHDNEQFHNNPRVDISNSEICHDGGKLLDKHQNLGGIGPDSDRIELISESILHHQRHEQVLKDQNIEENAQPCLGPEYYIRV